MVAFLIGFFLIYTLLHCYVFVRAHTALRLGGGAAIAVVFVMVTMIVAPVIVRFLENARLDLFARVMAHVGYTWLGLLFLLVCATVAIDLYRLLVHVSGRVFNADLSWLTISPGAYFVLSVAIVAVIAAYGCFEALQVRSEKLIIRTPKIPAGVSPLRIVQISDVHLGLIVREGRLKRIMEQVEKADPHIFVSTGDLVDGQMGGLDGLAELLQKVKPRLGKFAVTGNHEFYAGLPQALAFTEKSGFRVLRGEAVTIARVINVVGVDDPAGPGVGASSKGEGELLRITANGLFTLFLKHRPVPDTESATLFDLQLSGHVHYGQIFPFRLITRLFYPFYGGLYSFPSRSSLYVNRGSGTWGPPIRFLAPPEVTVIELIHTDRVS